MNTESRQQKRTVFPARVFGNEVFGVQSTNDKDKSNANGDKIRRHDLPANRLVEIRGGAGGGTRHLVLPASSI